MKKVNVAIFLIVLSALMAVPMMMMLQLHVYGWDIMYLNVIPIWVIFGITCLLQKPSKMALSRWIVFWYLSYWLFYDFTWWGITSIAAPDTIGWNATFYFDIIVRDPPMWFFLSVAIVGFLLAITLLQIKRIKSIHLLPYILYLIYVYGIGGYAQYINDVDDSAFIVWSVVFIPIIMIAFIYTQKIGRKIRSIFR
jgi:hypothetical protein